MRDGECHFGLDLHRVVLRVDEHQRLFEDEQAPVLHGLYSNTQKQKH